MVLALLSGKKGSVILKIKIHTMKIKLKKKGCSNLTLFKNEESESERQEPKMLSSDPSNFMTAF